MQSSFLHGFSLLKLSLEVSVVQKFTVNDGSMIRISIGIGIDTNLLAVHDNEGCITRIVFVLIFCVGKGFNFCDGFDGRVGLFVLL